THSRGIAGRQGTSLGGGYGVQTGVSDDYRYARNHRGFGHLPLRIWDRTGAGLCRDPDYWFDSKPVYRRLCIAGDLLLAPGEDATPGGPEYLKPFSGTNRARAVSN